MAKTFTVSELFYFPQRVCQIVLVVHCKDDKKDTVSYVFFVAQHQRTMFLTNSGQ